ncbi:MAG: signal peptidase II [Acidimicrobiia bacterium]
MIRRYLLAVGLASAIVILDLLTKRYAALHFTGNPVEVIPGFLTFTYTENPGSAFSFFQGGGSVIGVIVIAVTVAVLWALRNDHPRPEQVAFGMIIGGALGNLADRVFRGPGMLDGRVIDWIDLWWIPTFNVADMSVTFAVAVLIIYAWISRDTASP